jgi:hypothetical protein
MEGQSLGLGWWRRFKFAAKSCKKSCTHLVKNPVFGPSSGMLAIKALNVHMAKGAIMAACATTNEKKIDQDIY